MSDVRPLRGTGIAPAGRPSADRRAVTVGDVSVYLDRDKVAATLTVEEFAVAYHVMCQVAERADLMAEMGLTSLQYRQAFARAHRKMAATVHEQVAAPEPRRKRA